MTIQFKCGQCGQTLKVGDNAAGKRAKCPKCQSVVSIPEVSAESPDLGPVPPPPPQPKPDSAGDEWDRFMDSPFPKDAENPYQSPTATKEPQYLPKGDPKTVGSQPVRNVPTEFGSIMNYSWAVWKENLGLLIGAMVVVMIIGGAVSGVSEVFFNIIAKTDLRRLIPVIALASMLVQTCVNTFLTVGLMQSFSNLRAVSARISPTCLVAASCFFPLWEPTCSSRWLPVSDSCCASSRASSSCCFGGRACSWWSTGKQTSWSPLRWPGKSRPIT